MSFDTDKNTELIHQYKYNKDFAPNIAIQDKTPQVPSRYDEEDIIFDDRDELTMEREY